MSSSLRWFAVPLSLLMIAAESHADVAGPCLFPFGRRDPRPWERGAPMSAGHDVVIERDPNAKVAELRIPRRMLVANASRPVSTRHAMAGLAISMAFVGGGLWCMRYRAGTIPKKKVLVGAVVGVLALGLLSVINIADATPPRKPDAALVFKTVQLADVEVVVNMVVDGDEVRLILPAEIADKLQSR